MREQDKDQQNKQIVRRPLPVRWILVSCMAAMGIIYVIALYDPARSAPVNGYYSFVCPLTWSNIARGIQDADEVYQTDTRMMGSTVLDSSAQAKEIQKAVLSGQDGIITGVAEDTAQLRQAIKDAADQGIPVILVDSDLADSPRNCYIGTDNKQMGRLAGEDMVSATDGKAQIGIIVSDKSVQNQMERVQSFTEVIGQHPEMEIVSVAECHSERLEILEELPRMLRENPQINAIYLTEAIGTSTAGGILTGDEFAHRQISVIGTDFVEDTKQYLEEGIYYSVIVQDPYSEGYLAVETLAQISRGEAVDDIIYTDVHSITADNMQDSQLLIQEEIPWNYY